MAEIIPVWTLTLGLTIIGVLVSGVGILLVKLAQERAAGVERGTVLKGLSNVEKKVDSLSDRVENKFESQHVQCASHGVKMAEIQASLSAVDNTLTRHELEIEDLRKRVYKKGS